MDTSGLKYGVQTKTGNLRPVQPLLGQTKMGRTVRYLGVELEDALAIAEATEIKCIRAVSALGPEQSQVAASQFCGRSPHDGHSCRLQHLQGLAPGSAYKVVAWHVSAC